MMAIVLLAFHAMPAAALPRPPATPAPVVLTLEPTGDRDHFVFALTNESAEPVRLLASRFLVGLELRPEGRRGGVRRCSAPVGLAPAGVVPDRIVALDPGERYDEQIDVRFFCWGQSKLRAKAHSVKATYGRRGRASTDRWVVSNADGTGGHHARLESEPLAVPAAPDPPTASTEPRRGLELRASNAQAWDGREVVVGLRLVNHGPDPVDVFLHPFAYRFRVSSASGEVACAVHDPERVLSRDRFTRIRRGGIQSARLDLAQFCPRDTFEVPGLYEVRSEVVLSEDGASAGLSAFSGTVAAEPIVVRVSRGHAGRYVRSAAR